MWDYTDKVMDHFLQPRNTGAMDDADAVGEVGNIVCGDAIKLYLKLSDDKKSIEKASFQTFGCASAIASASALTEILRGKTLQDAATLSNQDIADYLGELPEAKMHCSVMGMEAFQAAIKDLKKKFPEIELPEVQHEAQGQDRIVCHCFNVSEAKIREVTRANDLTSVEQITHYSKAGGGCGECIPEIEKILADVLGEKTASATSTAGGQMTNLQKIKLIQEVFDRVIRPGLQADGGDIELVDIDGDKVLVRLQGRCAACHSAEQTLRLWVEANLHEKVSASIIVEEVG
ncbi:MAG: Fe-S cluster assembly protein NifU [Oligosphaeraceae bacterium]|nr:Fe-S cluster assembly protein NifU [Oligosphaeraceae bacterium]